jgi:hypothetical protein
VSHVTNVGTTAQIHRNDTSALNINLPGVFEKRLRFDVRALFTRRQDSLAANVRHRIQLQAVNQYRSDGSTPRTHKIELTDEAPQNVKHSSRLGA